MYLLEVSEVPSTRKGNVVVGGFPLFFVSKSAARLKIRTRVVPHSVFLVVNESRRNMNVNVNENMNTARAAPILTPK